MRRITWRPQMAFSKEVNELARQTALRSQSPDDKPDASDVFVKEVCSVACGSNEQSAFGSTEIPRNQLAALLLVAPSRSQLLVEPPRSQPAASTDQPDRDLLT